MSWTGAHGAAGGDRPTLDWIDVLIQTAVTICLVILVSVMVDQAGGPAEAAGLAVAAASLVLLGYRRTRARRAAPGGGDDDARLHEIEERLGLLEAGHDRVLELEERLDFAERLLAQQRDVDRIPGERLPQS